MARRRSWRDLTRQQLIGTVVLGAVQLALLGAALWDISRRPAARIRGSKGLWTALSFINFVGPIAYFAAGRR